MFVLAAFAWTVVIAVLPLPAEGPAVANALLLSAPLAILTTWAGCLCGAAISFELARRWGRPFAERWLDTRVVARVDRAVLGAGWLGLLGLRLLPAISFTGINWAAGFAPVSRRAFYATTALGILPGCVAFTFLAQRGMPLLPEGTLVVLGLGLLSLAVGQWQPAQNLLRSWAQRIASGGPIALRFRAGAVGGLLLAACLAAFAPQPRSGEAASLADHASCEAVGVGVAPSCCPDAPTKAPG